MRRALLSLALLVPLAGCGAHTAGPADPSGRAHFLEQLAVLRRSARPSDTTPALTAALVQRAHFPGCAAQVAERGLTRRLRPGIYLVVFRPARCVLHCTGTGRSCARPQPMQEWAALVPAGSLEPAGYWTSADLATGQAFGFLENRTVLLVPDGVSQVMFGGDAVTVRDNVVLLPPSASVRVRWLNAGGRVIRTYVL